MSTRARQYAADVLGREQLSPHLVRLSLGGPGLASFSSTGVPDEWVGLVVPGQFQSRYYTVRSWSSPSTSSRSPADSGAALVLDVVMHEEGLVTEWASGPCVGERVTVTEPRSSFAMPESAGWLMLVGDLTALPAMARIASSVRVPTRIWAEVADESLRDSGYLPPGPEVTWLAPPGEGCSALAAVVEAIDWPAGHGYFWMAGESAQMRAIRKHLMRDRRLPSASYDVMGYWRGGAQRQPRSVDPAPVWRAGKRAGHSDERIWADYDAASDRQRVAES